MGNPLREIDGLKKTHNMDNRITNAKNIVQHLKHMLQRQRLITDSSSIQTFLMKKLTCREVFILNINPIMVLELIPTMVLGLMIDLILELGLHQAQMDLHSEMI